MIEYIYYKYSVSIYGDLVLGLADISPEVGCEKILTELYLYVENNYIRKQLPAGFKYPRYAIRSEFSDFVRLLRYVII